MEPEYRGQYLATAIVSELLEWGAERGAAAWMHVEEQQYARSASTTAWDSCSPRKSHYLRLTS
ncbi:MAG: hypothetical protein R2709_05230 [Marmoricola sp.]